MNRSLLFMFMLALIAPLPAFAENRTLSVDDYLDAVREQSPDLEVEKANLHAVRARASGIRLAPPMFGLMQMKEGNERFSGFEISQEIPFPTKIYQERRVRLLEAEAQEIGSTSNRSRILSDARFAYVSFWAAQEKLNVLRERHAWLKQHSRLARTVARYDSEAQLHVLEIESDADLAENETLAAEAELIEKKNALKVFAPDLDTSNVAAKEPNLLPLNVDTSSAASLVQWKEKEFESAQAMTSLARNSYMPDFFLRLRQFDASAMTSESQEFMFGISLPFLFFWQPRAEIAEARAKEMSAQASLRKEKLAYGANIDALLEKEKALRNQLEVLKEKLLPRSARRSRLVKNISQRTMDGLDQHNSVMLSHLDLRLKEVELQLEHERLIREVTALTGGASSEGISR